jgi:hypothetical protein
MRRIIDDIPSRDARGLCVARLPTGLPPRRTIHRWFATTGGSLRSITLSVRFDGERGISSR